MLVALDIETEALNKSSPADALIPHLSRITCVGLWCPDFSIVFRDLTELSEFLKNSPQMVFVGQNFKFDLKHLYFHGIEIPLEKWIDDTQLMASNMLEKIPEEWLEKYREKRKLENKKLKAGFRHRKAGLHSLKTLAPYFLNIPLFWEKPENHDDDDYVLKDCEYTYKLYQLFHQKMEQEGTFDFYKKRQLPWAKMLLMAELKGITLDLNALKEAHIEAINNKAFLEARLYSAWSQAFHAWAEKKEQELLETYSQMKVQAIQKLTKPSEVKIQNIQERYSKLYNEAKQKIDLKLSLSSPAQMNWLLKDYFGFDIEIEKRNKETNQTEFKDSTGEEVLQRIYQKTKREDIKVFLEYRATTKLIEGFFETYQRLQLNGKLHPCFNPDGTKTGRISCSDPNLQQVPKGLHRFFKARDGYELITKDMSAIEPHLIAYYTDDPELFKTVKEFHANNVRVFFGLQGTKKEIKENHEFEYDLAKEAGLALCYGAGGNRIRQCAQKRGVDWPESLCKEMHRKFKETYETVFEFKENLDRLAASKPYGNIFGRKTFFIQKDDIYMKAFNRLIQSSASDLVLNSSHKIMEKFKEFDIDGHILLWVHDEIVVEVRKDQVEQANSIIIDALTNYDLPTSFGPIKLEVEGHIGHEWIK